MSQYIGEKFNLNVIHNIPNIIIDSDSTVTLDNQGFQILVDTTLIDVNLTLPSVNDVPVGFVIYIQKLYIDNVLNIILQSGEHIDGEDNITITSSNDGIGIVNTGVSWSKFGITGIPLASDTQKGITEIATQLETNQLTRDDVVVTPATIGNAISGISTGKSFTTNGYIIFNTGLIIQWGQRSVPRGQVWNNLPITFPNKFLQGSTCRMYDDPNGTGVTIPTEDGHGIIATQNHRILLHNTGVGGLIRWVALGH